MRYTSDFIAVVKQRQAEIAESLVRGECMTFEAYQRLVGTHAGLAEALSILNNLLEESDENE